MSAKGKSSLLYHVIKQNGKLIGMLCINFDDSNTARRATPSSSCATPTASSRRNEQIDESLVPRTSRRVPPQASRRELPINSSGGVQGSSRRRRRRKRAVSSRRGPLTVLTPERAAFKIRSSFSQGGRQSAQHQGRGVKDVRRGRFKKYTGHSFTVQLICSRRSMITAISAQLKSEVPGRMRGLDAIRCVNY